MKVFKVKVMSGASILTTDGIEWKGKLWLVSHWLDNPSQKVTAPGRIIRFDSLPHQKLPAGNQFGDYLLQTPIPKELLDFQTPKQTIADFEYEELPDLTVPLPEKKG